MTGPLDDLDAMRAKLGLRSISSTGQSCPAALLGEWEPEGAIWFAQACCSAGCDKPSAYPSLFPAGSRWSGRSTGIAELGATTSPLARALLGAAKPLRAYIGQVEPTFDWTMSFPLNRQELTTTSSRRSITALCGGKPVRLAMSGYYPAIASKLQQYLKAKDEYD